MQSFVLKHAALISAVLSCFDRVVFRGHLQPLSHPRGLEGFLTHQGLLLKDFKAFAPQLAEQLTEHGQQLAQQHGRPFQYLSKRTRLQELAQSIAQRDGVTEGLVCVLATQETCSTFRLAYGRGRPQLKRDYRRCKVLYYYFLDAEFGLIHVKLQSWFPFPVQVYVNGHEWLARRLSQAGIAYRQVDNAFAWLADPEHAQGCANQFCRLRWPQLLQRWAALVNPLLNEQLRGLSYYWVTEQAEFATDVLFKDRASLQGLYERLLQHATLCLSAEDVLKFLGRKLVSGFAGEVLNDCKKRWPGARVKHRMKGNWLKMYDKHGVVLRIETVINDPREFRVRRWVERHGQRRLLWVPMRKGVCNLWRYAEVSLQANRRYLEALAVVDDARPAQQRLEKASEPVRSGGQRRRALNLLGRADRRLFTAVLRGEHLLRGFKNSDVAQALYGTLPQCPEERRRLCGRVCRQLGLLRAHGLIAKIPRSRRYRVTAKGHAVMGSALQVYAQSSAVAQPNAA